MRRSITAPIREVYHQRFVVLLTKLVVPVTMKDISTQTVLWRILPFMAHIASNKVLYSVLLI